MMRPSVVAGMFLSVARMVSCDPFHRALDANGNEMLHAWKTDPLDNTAAGRPAIVWVHGGGSRPGSVPATGCRERRVSQ